MRRDAPQLGSWHGRLEALAGRAAASLHPEPNRSIGTILKIKTLAGGSAADSRYVDGVVCRLRLADKRMATRLPSPRILLLDCALEHEAGGVSTSLEGLGRQEDEHMTMVVAELAKLRVDLLLVSGSVCFTAKTKLLEAKIALVVKVIARDCPRLSEIDLTVEPSRERGVRPTD